MTGTLAFDFTNDFRSMFERFIFYILTQPSLNLIDFQIDRDYKLKNATTSMLFSEKKIEYLNTISIILYRNEHSS